MRLNYLIQHKLFKEFMLKRIREDAIKTAIDEENGNLFVGLLMSAANYFSAQAPEEKDGMNYEASFVTSGNVKAVRCKFTGSLVLVGPECASILVAVTDRVYYFTVECSITGGYMLCRWDDEKHLNYGAIDSDDPELYMGLIEQIVNS